MPAKRKNDIKVPNLYLKRNKYVYRMPDGTTKTLGTEQLECSQTALALNTHFAQKSAEAHLVELAGDMLLPDLITQFIPVKQRAVAASTFKEVAIKLRRYMRELASVGVARVTVRELDDYLMTAASTPDTYRLHRLLLIELFDYALGKGYRAQIAGNPAKALLPPKLAREKKGRLRKRLTLDQFLRIRSAAPDWFQVAMDIALQTGIRRGDLVRLKWDNWDGEVLRLIPNKTAENPNPVALAIKAGDQLKEVFARAKSLPPISQFIIHRANSNRITHQRSREDRNQVTAEQLTRAFRQLKNDVLGAKVNTSFHEIRSLSGRLYRELGRDEDSIQELYGHASKSMTEVYLEDGVEWTDTWASLDY